MKIINGIENLKTPIKGSVLTVGVFDGIHLGHKKIITEVSRRARSLKLSSAVITFNPHPLKVLKPHSKVPSLISLKHRVNLIKGLGIDIILIVHFTKEFAEMPAEKFVSKILVGHLGVKEMYVSENFLFGRGQKGDIGLLRELSKRFGFKIVVLKPLRVAKDVVSSSLIRELITKGELKKASMLLGRPVTILGTVVGGSMRGRKLGIPTANVNPHHEAIPPSGVYAVRVLYGNRKLKGLLNIGFRPTFEKALSGQEPIIEAHIIDFDEDIYGKDIEIIFIRKLRREQTFKSKEALIKRIKEDIKSLYKIT